MIMLWKRVYQKEIEREREREKMCGEETADNYEK